jgi:two-component system response regulator HydG
MTLGAVDYLTKPLKPREIVARIGLIVRHRRLEAELHLLQGELRSRYDMHSVVASSTHMMAVVAALHRIKDAEEPVVLHGEPGSGRKFTARAIHYNGVRRSEPYVVLDCEAPPAGGLECALFGEASGARHAKRGVLERAASGSVLVASLELADRALQAEIAQCIATRRWRRRNDGAECALEARLLLSCGAPPGELIDTNDLAPELGVLRDVVTIQVPPLRQRGEDLPGLVTAFLADYSLEHGRNLALAPHAIEALAAESFPGNVAQLFTVLAHCATISVDGVMSRENLERSLRQSSLSSDRPIADHLGDREYQLVLRAVQRNSGRLDQAARELGVSRTTLWRRMRKYGIKLALT